MNNLLIAVLTFVMLPALSSNSNASAKCNKSCREAKTEFSVEKMNFTGDILQTLPVQDETTTTVEVDYIIDENGKAVVTYVQAADETAKNNVVKFIESSSYNYNMVPGKIYTLRFTLN